MASESDMEPIFFIEQAPRTVDISRLGARLVPVSQKTRCPRKLGYRRSE